MTKILLALLIAFLMLFVAATTQSNAAPLLTAQDDCLTNGGRWIHFGSTDGENGYCILPVGSAVALASCSSDEYVEQFYDGGSLLFDDCYSADGSDGNDSSGCQYVLGGSFFSAGAYSYCTVTHDYIGDCPGQSTTYNYYNGSLIGFSCSGGAIYGGGYGGYGEAYGFLNQFKHHITDDDAGELDMQKKNGEFDYDAGTCSGKCIISPSIPYPALKTLPDDATDKLYIRLVDENGDSIEGSYTVCFDLGEVTNPIVYRYIGGAWVPQAISVGDDRVCTSATGDGVFALGGNTDIQEHEEDLDQPAPYVYPYP